MFDKTPLYLLKRYVCKWPKKGEEHEGGGHFWRRDVFTFIFETLF